MSNSNALATLLVAAGICTACGSNAGHGTRDGAGSNVDQDAGNCASSQFKAASVPLDMFVMLDQSSSMGNPISGNTGPTKWQEVTDALNSFVTQTGLTGIAMGLQFFGLPANSCTAYSCQQDSDCGDAACGPCDSHVCFGALTNQGDSCDTSKYATAAVAIAPLPGVGSAITQSISQHMPVSGTPTYAALQGAVDYAGTWATAHPQDAIVVVLATDGDPEQCDLSLSDIETIASTAAMATPKILTAVIGVGSSLSNLNGIAAAGGTGSAFLVDTGGNVAAQFLMAMNTIRQSVLACQYQIPVPQSGTPNYQQINVVYTPGNGGAAETFPYVNGKAECPMTGNAWYYDDPDHPSEIILCDPTCALVAADTAGEVDITEGCATVIE